MGVLFSPVRRVKNLTFNTVEMTVINLVLNGILLDSTELLSDS